MDELPLLPLKDVVVFPRMVVPLLVGRPASLTAVEDSLASGCPLFLCAQRDASVESPQWEDMYEVGVAANILQTLRMPDGTMKVVVEGLGRGRIEEYRPHADSIIVLVSPLAEKPAEEEEREALMRSALSQFGDYVRRSQRVAPDIVTSLQSVDESNVLADLLCAYLPVRADERQGILETLNVGERLEKITAALIRENELLEIEGKVRERVREQMERSQREFYLQEQLKAIHQELGSRGEGGDEFSELRDAIERAKMPKEVREKAMRELGRYERMPTMSPESTVARTYLEWLTDMPWRKRTRDHLDLEEAKRVLDEDHYGLTKVKERILEFLAVRKLSKSARGPILCLVGPPGVGKTSLGRSIGRAMKRKFVRVSLGGVRDEAEIRGHRRTYIGALPGRIVQSIKRSGVKNPVFMLDEVDKMSTDFRGDPSSALLEVLDPEQNSSFSDHYLEVDFDLSEVFFITTANSEYDIPPALHDRMEVVRLAGYTAFEKERIARLFLIPKQMAECGLEDKHLRFADSGVNGLIRFYTRRKDARKVVSRKRPARTVVTDKRLGVLLGPPEYTESRADAQPQVGVAVGLAWTMSGGDILNVETSTTKGKGGLTLTGQLGDIMKESAQAAYTYLRAHARDLRIPVEFHKNKDLHVHVPEGAIPKDGPSAGTAIAVSMLSALRGKAPAASVAMTGEITLRGRVLPVGGIKEKVLAAHRAGLSKVLLPKENEKDLVEIPKEVRKDLALEFVDNIDDVFGHVFSRAARKKA